MIGIYLFLRYLLSYNTIMKKELNAQVKIVILQEIYILINFFLVSIY